jgi:hypothetical protein
MVLGIIALYGVIVVRSLARLLPERDPFARLAGAGLACVFGVQAMINMGVAVRLLPAKGMTLALRQLWRIVDHCRRDHHGDAAGADAGTASRADERTSDPAGAVMAKLR